MKLPPAPVNRILNVLPNQNPVPQTAQPEEEFPLLELAELTKLGEVGKQTQDDYRRCCRRWKEFWDSQPDEVEYVSNKRNREIKYRCMNPVLHFPRIEKQHIEIWQKHLLNDLELSPRQVDKHVGWLMAILSAGSKQGYPTEAKPYQVPAAPEAIDTGRRRAPKLYHDREQLGLIYDACQYAQWPRRRGGLGRANVNTPLPFKPAAYWRAAVVLYSNFGFRTQELIAFEKTERPLTWSNISTATKTPNLEGLAHNEWGWLDYVPTKQERAGKRQDASEPVIVPLVRCVRAHLESIRPKNWKPDDPIFPFPFSNADFYATWRVILAQSGVVARVCRRTGKQYDYKIAHFRKTATTLYNNHCRGLGPIVCGHSERDLSKVVSDVSDKHYDNPESWLVEQLSSFEQPAAFGALHWDPHDPQKRLF